LFLQFDHRTLEVAEFAPIPIPTAYGTLVITQAGGGDGTFRPSTGDLSLDIRLDYDIPDPEGTSHIHFHFSTSPPGSSMDASGNVTLHASSTFHGSVLDGEHSTMTLKGRISPDPRTC
jgi:hypothetical protein